MKFSQKIGKTSIRDAFQIEKIDSLLENRIWNDILIEFFDKIIDLPYSNVRTSYRDQACQVIWKEFFGNRTDEIPSYGVGINFTKFLDFLKKWFFKSEWYEKYDFLEFLARIDKRALKIGFIEKCNASLKREMSGYRIVDECIVKIIAEEEIKEIEEAVEKSSKWKPVNTHIKASIEYFSKRKNPNYRNSIKESISAVEA